MKVFGILSLIILCGCANRQVAPDTFEQGSQVEQYFDCVEMYSKTLALKTKETPENIAEASLSKCVGFISTAMVDYNSAMSQDMVTSQGRMAAIRQTEQASEITRRDARALAVRTVIESRMEK